jgi:hypothetical protein
MDVKENQVRNLLHRFGEALSDGDLLGIQSCWTIPALVLADREAIPLLNSAEIERLFTRAIHVHRFRGLISEKPQIVRFEPMNDHLFLVTASVLSVVILTPDTDRLFSEARFRFVAIILPGSILFCLSIPSRTDIPMFPHPSTAILSLFI